MEMNIPLTIGFEAHDGSGKTTTSLELMEVLCGDIWFAEEGHPRSPPRALEMKKKRKEIISKYQVESSQLDEVIISNYEDECELIQEFIEQNNSQILITDRTYISYVAEKFANTPLNERLKPSWITSVFKPEILLEIVLEERVRKKRIVKRATEEGKELNYREKRLAEDKNYRNDIEEARKILGCIPLRIRERNPRVVCLRVLQVLLSKREVSLNQLTLDSIRNFLLL